MLVVIHFTSHDQEILDRFQSAEIITESGREIFTSDDFDKFHLKRNAEFVFSDTTKTIHAFSEGISYIEFKC